MLLELCCGLKLVGGGRVVVDWVVVGLKAIVLEAATEAATEVAVEAPAFVWFCRVFAEAIIDDLLGAVTVMAELAMLALLEPELVAVAGQLLADSRAKVRLKQVAPSGRSL